ncbi:hypothetical protein LAZ67_12002609 [Cordylochernes scorpioides]|uniref:C2H2-type domain-containing protein n=1 Tax=Cordylochernes scorpioides TaxID=51811 RepID=A0ABY6L5W0_9ARAC|nr:hypothetical protein LAZ67_12002609 [Cordylochernes scorpioides]
MLDEPEEWTKLLSATNPAETLTFLEYVALDEELEICGSPELEEKKKKKQKTMRGEVIAALETLQKLSKTSADIDVHFEDDLDKIRRECLKQCPIKYHQKTITDFLKPAEKTQIWDILCILHMESGHICSRNGEPVKCKDSYLYDTRFIKDILFNTHKNTVEKHFTCFISNFRKIYKKCSIIHQRKHAGEKLKFCPNCEYSTKRTSNLKSPIKIHTDEKLHQCPHCDHRTMQLGSLKRHIRTHTSERPHLCPHCDYRTNHPSDSKKHIRTHTDEKPYLCPHCDYRAISSSTLRRHIRTHTGERPHLCPHCDYRTNHTGGLKCHIRTHTGEKPYLCPFQSFLLQPKINPY